MDRYKADIDINDKKYSKAFRDFYHHHFIDSFGLGRNEVDLSFFQKMSISELDLAKELIRQNLFLKYVHIIKAAGDLKDEKSLPILFDLQKKCKDDFSRILTISQAIWKINGDNKYYNLLHKLVNSQDVILKQAHFEQIMDMPADNCINSLIKLLYDENALVVKFSLNYLNLYMTNKFPAVSEDPAYSVDYFKNNQNNKDILANLIANKNASR